MIVFGCISSLFDYATFGVLYWLFHAGEEEFRSAWFLESVWSAALIVLAIRTKKLAWRSRPGTLLSVAVFAVLTATYLLPLTPFGALFALSLPTLPLTGALLGIIALYFISVEMAKKVFY